MTARSTQSTSRNDDEQDGLDVVAAFAAGEGGGDVLALAGVLASDKLVCALVVPFPPGSVGEPPLELPETAESWDRLCDRLRTAGMEALRSRAAPRLAEREIEPRVLLDDSPPRALSGLCESESADLIVIGSSRRGRLGRVFAGGTAERVLAGSSCAVAVAPRGYASTAPAPPSRIGVGFDGSEAAERALDFAARLAARSDAEIEIAGVARPLGQLQAARLAAEALAGRGLVDRSIEQLRRAAELRADQLPRGVEAVVRVDHGDPAVALRRRSAHLDLLVVGSRGYGAVRGTLLGSVSAKLVRSAECPIVVVP